jgi:hypothetical protein
MAFGATTGEALQRSRRGGAYAIIEDKKGNIWTTGEVKPNGDWALFRYDQKSLYSKKPIVTDMTSKYEGYNKNLLLGIIEANDGSIWVGGADGVYRYDGNTFKNLKRKEGQQ